MSHYHSLSPTTASKTQQPDGLAKVALFNPLRLFEPLRFKSTVHWVADNAASAAAHAPQIQEAASAAAHMGNRIPGAPEAAIKRTFKPVEYVKDYVKDLAPHLAIMGGVSGAGYYAGNAHGKTVGKREGAQMGYDLGLQNGISNASLDPGFIGRLLEVVTGRQAAQLPAEALERQRAEAINRIIAGK